jgi:hypothetical protein
MGEYKRKYRRRYDMLVMISTGETHSVSEWAAKNGVDPETILSRLKEGRHTDVAVGNSVHSIVGPT